MSHPFADRAYVSSPAWLQRLGVQAYGHYWRWARFGGAYEAHCLGYRTREWADPAAWQKIQRDRLRGLLKRALETPYYRERWTSQQKDAALAGRLEELPPLSKHDVRRNPAHFLAGRGRPKLTFHTSGSTGTPVATYWSFDELRESMALREVRSAAWAGVSFADPRATFSGRVSQPDADARADIYRFNQAERQVYLSPYHLSPKTVRLYLDALRRHDTRWGTGYAVSFYLLAALALDQGLPVPQLDAIVTTSEKLTPKMRSVISSAFGCSVFEEYSTVENVVFASECPSGSLHVSPDACWVEILRPDGTEAPPGEVGEVVATGLFRVGQPLVRYRLGDLATWAVDPCVCGRSMPVLAEVIGRLEDVIVGTDGRQLVRFHGVFVDLPAVREGQIVQHSLDRLSVKIVPEPSFGKDDEALIVQRVEQRMGSDVNVSVELVESIDRDGRGKFRAVISELPSEDLRSTT